MPEPYRLVAAVAFDMVKFDGGVLGRDNVLALRAELKEHGLYLSFDSGFRQGRQTNRYGWVLHTGYCQKRGKRTLAFGTIGHVCRHAMRLANPVPEEETHDQT